MESTYTVSFFLFLLSFFYHFLNVSASSTVFPNEALPTKTGYLPINNASASAFFYTFYEAQTSVSPVSQTPLLIWLQGGPGCSSMIGNFLELGPWRVTSSNRHNVEHLSLEANPGAWNRIYGLLFLDNPIGTGFSIAATSEEIPTNQKAVAKHLYAAISGFVNSDPLFKNRPIYISGESYAGKYVPAIGYYILKKNMKSPESKQVNLAGVAIGDGLTDPIIQVKTHAVNAYFTGLINERQKLELEEAQSKAIQLVKTANWSQATDARNQVLGMLTGMTGLATLYDFTKKVPYKTSLVAKFLNEKEPKEALGVNETIIFDECSDIVGAALHADVMKSVKYMVEYLVKETRVLLYQGHYDLRDGVVSTEAWVRTMKWVGIKKFLMAERNLWKVNGEVAGYVQKWGSLSNVVLLGAGHLVPTDKAVNSQAMIENWVSQKGLFENHKEEEDSASISRRDV